ncbi:hypothetical protein [Streptomyces sp. NBC_00887]|uniref:hypothetical protein n=1 Tax=Streptomyces sp. NBC_00887 TaxID=2975859 RepID=UPI00386732A7|nr:hypothetical protein OG844_46195 [Streptomyces sp. NBC_00887]
MSTTRRPLRHGPQIQAQAPSAGAGATRKMRATEADIEAAPLYRPGGLDSLQQLRDRGVLVPGIPPA